MTRVHHQCLFVGHLAQILHGEQILGPVLEYGAIAAVGDEFVRMLGHGAVEVVLYHHHDGSRLTRTCRILVNRARVHLVVGAEAIHVYAAVAAQLVGELRGENGMVLFREIPERVFECETFLLGSEDFLTPRRMIHRCVVRLGRRQFVGNACPDGVAEFVCCHFDDIMVLTFSIIDFSAASA